MPTLRATIALYDGATSPLLAMNRAMNTVLNTLESMQTASGRAIDVSSIQVARDDLARAQTQLEGINRELEEANRNTQKVESSTGSLTNTVRNLAGAYLGIEGLKALVTTSDSMTQITARLDMMNDGLQTTAELNQMVYESAQRSRGSYQDTANFIAKLGTLTEGVFDSNEELIAFAEQINKQMALSGTTTQEASGAMLQLTQALASGTLRGEELNSVLEQTPMVAQTIAEYMGVSVGEMRNLASEGAITAEVVKNALLYYAKETDEAFGDMPMTWAQVWNSFSNTALMAMQPVLGGINAVANNIEIIAPIAIGVAAAIGTYMIAAHGAAAATKVWTAAQAVLNAVMALNPVALIIISIIALIAIIYAVVAAVNKFTGQTISAAGIIVGAITVAGAVILNIVIGLINAMIQLVWNNFVYPFIGIIEWVLNVANGGFNSFGDAVANLIGNIIGWFLSLGEVVTKIIDAIFGTNWTGGLESLKNEVISWGKNENAITLDRNAPEIGRIEYGDAWDAGYNFGQGIENKLGDFFSFGGMSMDMGVANFDVPSYDELAGQTDVLDGIAGDTSSISDSMEITEEDLKYLRDIATREAINRFTTAQIKIDQKNENHIASDMDVDGIMDIFAIGFADRLNISAEGVHV